MYPAVDDLHAKPPPPQVFGLTPAQAAIVNQWPGADLIHWVFLEIHPVPGGRPFIHVPDPDKLPHHRVTPSIEYLDGFVSDFILHPNYFHRYLDRFSNGPLTCVVQVGDGAQAIVPSAGFCAADPRVTLIPDLTFWHDRGYYDVREEIRQLGLASWRDKIPVAFWRGSTTGGGDVSPATFPLLPRYRLCQLSLARQDDRQLIDARLTSIVQAGDDDAARIRELAGSLGMLAPRIPQSEFARYRYLIDIDGNTNSWGLFAKLLMGSCILKVQSECRQWYYRDLRPWEHYIPIRADLSDLEDKVLWCREHDDDARQIAEASKQFADERVFGIEMARAVPVLLDGAMPLATQPRPSMAPGLQIEPVENGYVVQQPGRGEAHHLNSSAAVLLEMCNGSNPETELPRLVQLAYGMPEPPVESVKNCLDDLKKVDLVR